MATALNSKVTCLERHAYAPELNRLHLKSGASFPVPHCTTIAQAIKRISPKAARGIYAQVTFERKDSRGNVTFSKVYSGFVNSRLQALAFAREKQATTHAGGRLFDGSELPRAEYRIRFVLKG